MRPVELDLETADRILSGAVEAPDAPPGFEGVVALLAAAAATDEIDELSERRAAAAMAQAMRPASRSPFRRRGALALVCAAALLAATAGLAEAGVLPAPAQDAVSRVLDRVGVSVPRSSHAPAPRHHGVPGTNGDSQPAAPADGTAGLDRPAGTHEGREVGARRRRTARATVRPRGTRPRRVTAAPRRRPTGTARRSAIPRRTRPAARATAMATRTAMPTATARPTGTATETVKATGTATATARPTRPVRPRATAAQPGRATATATATARPPRRSPAPDRLTDPV